jgi:Family of unknown function (DUF5677)
MVDEQFQNDEALRLAAILIEKPLTWRQPSSGPPATYPVLRFVKFRAFIRAVTQFKSLVLLLKAGQWEDALILGRSLYELNVNLSALTGSPDAEAAAKRFVKFGKLQSMLLNQKRLTDYLNDARLESGAAEIVEYESQLAAIRSQLERDFADFADFRTAKGKWQESWSGENIEALAQRLAKDVGAQRGQSDYWVFRLGSLFTHNSPGSLLFVMRQDRETIDWNQFRAAIDNAGREGLRFFLHEASLCFVDIVGIAGDSIADYERTWFDDFALPLIDKM